jgi:gamma-glutamylcyclotransferase (GGCT)/AIG2-like uncharacterized protein YtfP
LADLADLRILFVYGTLKRGFHNHRFCAQALDIQPAWTWGRLYDLRAGFPALEVPNHLILAHGSDRPRRDARLQAKTPLFTVGKPPGVWDWVSGELVTLADPEADLPPIDRLEGFQANSRHNLYERVLVPIWADDGMVQPVWTYDGCRIAAGGIRCRFWPVNPRFSGESQ